MAIQMNKIFSEGQIKKLKDNFTDSLIALDEIEKNQEKNDIVMTFKAIGELVLSSKRINETLKEAQNSHNNH